METTCPPPPPPPAQAHPRPRLFQSTTPPSSMVPPVYSSQGVLSLTCSLSFSLQPIQRLKGKPDNAFGGKAAHLLALRTPSVFGAPDTVRPTVHPLASSQLPPGPALPGRSPPTTTPPPGLTLSTQPKAAESPGEASAPADLGTSFSMSARLSLIPRVLTPPGLPTKGALHSTGFPSSPATEEPRGDV